jgi:hypothetical protein
MRDKYLVGVVCFMNCDTQQGDAYSCIVQPETCEHAWRKEFCNGALCMFYICYGCTALLHRYVYQATSKDGKEAGIELIQPPADSKPGDRVYFEGPDFERTYYPNTMDLS